MLPSADTHSSNTHHQNDKKSKKSLQLCITHVVSHHSESFDCVHRHCPSLSASTAPQHMHRLRWKVKKFKSLVTKIIFFFLTYPQFKSKPFSSCAYVGQFLLFGILDTWSQIETTFSDKRQKTWHPSENFLTDEKHHIRHEWTFQCPRPPIGQWDEVLTQLVCGTRCEAFHWYRFSVTWAHAFTPFPAASSMLVNNRLPTENKHNSDDR